MSTVNDPDGATLLARTPSSPASMKEQVVATPQQEPKISQAKKWSLLAIFALSMFTDVLCYSAFIIFTNEISEDLGIVFEQQAWVIMSYASTFAAFLLFWGRVADLYSAKPVFTFGFVAFGTLNLIMSFLPNKYSLFVFRALAGVAGASLIPASYRLIVHVFEPQEYGIAFTIYGMSAALANVLGTIVAGLIEFIPNSGMMIAWRWFFRIVAIMTLPFAFASFYLVPHQKGWTSDAESKWKRLDIVGALLILSAIITLILGLTLGASHGWINAGFFVPFFLSFLLFPAFFIWEARLPATHALLPPATWRIPNFTMFIVFALQIYAWWSVNFLALVDNWMDTHGEKPVTAAVRLLPEGLAALFVVFLTTAFPYILAKPRWPIAGGQLLGVVGYILFTRGGTTIGSDYWRFIFPGAILGSAGIQFAFNGANVGIMTAVPPEMAGVAGAVFQVALQVGSCVGFSVQAGLETVNPGSIGNFSNIQASFYFQMGWCALWLVGFLVFYRPPKSAAPAGAVAAAEEGVLAETEKAAA